MRNFIPYGKQTISEDDINCVVDVLRSDFVTQGPMLEQFEQALADYTQAEHAVAVANATAALHLTCLAMGIQEGQLVWTVPNTFVASANCALYCGADVDFVDIDPDTGNLCVAALQRKLERSQRLPEALIVVHFAGASCDMEAIAKLAKRHDIKIIEDASHAIGGKYQNAPVGNCQYSDACVFSFHPVKIITTGEGGAVTTNDHALAQRIQTLRSHGITREAGDFRGAEEGSWYYEQQVLGFNYRLTDIQAALGLSQLKKLDSKVAARHVLVGLYNSYLSKIKGVSWLNIPDTVYSSHHLFVVQVDAGKRRAIFEQLRAAQIGVNVHYIPVHTQPYYRALGFKHGDFPQAENYYSKAITLPLHPELIEPDIQYICQQLAEALRATKS